MDRYEKACSIIRNTNDGNDLSTLELWLVEAAVNNHLNSAGWVEFENLYNLKGGNNEQKS